MITLVPVGGLANRMRAIASGVALAECARQELRVFWFRDQGLNCPFRELFLTDIPFPFVQVREATCTDLLLYDRPRRRNLYLPQWPQRWLFDACLREEEIIRKRDEGLDFPIWASTYGNVYIASYIPFMPYSCGTLQQVFRPTPAIVRAVDRIAGSFDSHTIGIHIRRTDNIQSIRLSPLSLFIDQIEKELLDDPQANFYLASDSPDDKAELIRIFGNRINTHQFVTARNSAQGIKDAATELYLLSRTRKILGSAWSSFSEIAAQLTDIPCIILKKES